MGYTTELFGTFQLDRKLDNETYAFLKKLNETRRMKRNVGPEYGVDGEFYVDGTGYCGQGDDKNIVNYNRPPGTQPGLWLNWTPTDDGMGIEWDGGEKFYCYVEWLQYIITKVLEPRGYTLNGEVIWQGEDSLDMGKIVVKNNKVKAVEAKVVYEEGEG